jgi:hypothetical protein
MASKDNSTVLKNVRQRNYLARDFDGFRAVILDYARQYYPDRIQDFSESSLGGLLMDMAAYVGDNMSFYMDHLYGELNSDTAIETNNIEKIIKNAGIPIVGSSPALVYVDFYIEVPVLEDGILTPDPTLLPTISAGGLVRSDSGIQFSLIEDVQFWHLDLSTGLISVDKDVIVTNGRKIGGNIVSKILKKSGLCSSGTEITQNFSLNDFIPFRRLTLSQKDVTEIISVIDGLGNSYYEVDSLSNDVVYKNVLNVSGNNALVKDALKVIPAPYRFTKDMTLGNRSTTLTFGGGTADSLDDDVIPDPSEFAISLPYSQTFSRVSINPQKMLKTATLGVAASNTTLTVTYRYGGGLDHNIAPKSIRDAMNISMIFPENPATGLQLQVKGSLEVSNPKNAAGGEDPPTTDQLLALVPTVKNSQERIVTKEDLIARVYSMPSNFGRVFRASVSKNPNNPLAAQLFIVSRNSNQELISSPDALKINLKRYLNSYRMISDAIDVLDAAIINLELYFQIVADPALNKSTLLQSIISDLQSYFNIKNFNINQPIVVSDIISIIFSKPGVIAVDKIQFNNMYGTIKNKQYSSIAFDVQLNTRNQILYPPTGAIFEVKYPDINITGKAVSNV